ncbi:MAG: TlpA disulfide reductase family protein [Candidatus Neomarinimicrobiota bacterium]|jgi:thiol-disulfide isomerase/thioredoxin|nr:TlpA disulfide reductase family protein [Candidatus Neomarinimicrobiota bacterium]|tara:strand:+ start:1684 stop:2172 length:489 start_codon:yes stop_codon:yes gene_type:complete
MNKKIISSLFILFQILLSQDISPNFSLKKINGRTVKIGEYLENGPVLINFWATWCAPCKKEMVFLEKFENEYKKEGFSVLSISIDSQKSLAQVRSYIRINNYSFDVFLDPNMQVFKKMNGNLMPTNILLDKKGNIIWRHYGYLPGDEKNMNLQIRSALNLNS